MDVSLLEVLCCPFCGTRLDLVDNSALARDGAERGPLLPRLSTAWTM